jgi:hypothetical protein
LRIFAQWNYFPAFHFLYCNCLLLVRDSGRNSIKLNFSCGRLLYCWSRHDLLLLLLRRLCPCHFLNHSDYVRTRFLRLFLQRLGGWLQHLRCLYLLLRLNFRLLLINHLGLNKLIFLRVLLRRLIRGLSLKYLGSLRPYLVLILTLQTLQRTSTWKWSLLSSNKYLHFLNI